MSTTTNDSLAPALVSALSARGVTTTLRVVDGCVTVDPATGLELTYEQMDEGVRGVRTVVRYDEVSVPSTGHVWRGDDAIGTAIATIDAVVKDVTKYARETARLAAKARRATKAQAIADKM